MQWLSVLFLFCPWPSVWAMHPGRMARLRQETVDMFYHGFDNYMKIAFPEDEVCMSMMMSRISIQSSISLHRCIVAVGRGHMGGTSLWMIKTDD